MTSITTALNAVQKGIPAITNRQSNVTIGTTAVIIYTCPAGRSALIKKIAVRTISYGGNVLLNTLINGQRIRRTNTPDVDADLVDQPQGAGSTLAAGETISLTGDNAADNGSMDTLTVVEEHPL